MPENVFVTVEPESFNEHLLNPASEQLLSNHSISNCTALISMQLNFLNLSVFFTILSSGSVMTGHNHILSPHVRKPDYDITVTVYEPMSQYQIY